MSYVYFVQAQEAGPIKVGIATSPRKRLHQIQCSSPFPVRMLGVIAGSRETERAIHEHLASWHLSGEWFLPSAQVLAYVEEQIRGNGVSEFGPEWMPRYDHPLCIWLAKNKIRAVEFAKRIGITPGAITSMYRDGTWVSRDLARKIYDATNGEVTPTDFMLWVPSIGSKAEAA